MSELKNSFKPFLPIEILGLGNYLPETIITNEDYYEKKFGLPAKWVEKVCGIKTRRRAAPNQACSDLAVEAAQKALLKAKLSPKEIDLVVLATVGPDYVAPPTSNIIQDALGLSNAVVFDINCVCVGFLWALVSASNFLATGKYRTALVVCSEQSFKGENIDDRDTFILLSDGAGAAVITKAEATNRGISYYFGADGTGWRKAIIATRYDGVLDKNSPEFSGNLPKEKYLGGITRNPPDMSLVKGNLNQFQMKGTAIYKFAVNALQDAVKKLLAETSLELEDISLFIPHQANLRILESARQKLGITKEKFFLTVEKYGNAAGATIPIALAEAHEKGLIKSGDLVMLVGFAAGLNWGSVLIKW